MKHNKRQTTNQKGGKMLSLTGVILMVAQMSGAQALNINNSGVMDEVIVTAPRYEAEDIAYSGMMPEVVVTASRYYSEAEMGMMPEVVVTASRSNTVFEYTTIGEKRDENGWNYHLLTIENMDYQTITYHN